MKHLKKDGQPHNCEPLRYALCRGWLAGCQATTKPIHGENEAIILLING